VSAPVSEDEARAFFESLRARGDAFVPPFGASVDMVEPSPILARYAREITAAKTRGLTLTAARIEAERAEYVERGE